MTQVGVAEADRIQLGINGFTDYARKRRIRIADNAGMVDASIIEYDSEAKLIPRFVDISRNPTLQAGFIWPGNDPATHGFTKVGSGTATADGAGWKIDTTSTDAATNYTKNSFPAGSFTNGFTLEIQPPTVASTEGDQAVAVRVENNAMN